MRLSDDADHVLMRGHVATRHYYLLNQAFVFRKAHYYLRAIVEKIALTGRLPDSLPSFPFSQKIFRAPSLWTIIVYLVNRCYSILLKRLRLFLGIHYRSTVAYLHSDWRNAELQNGTRLYNRPFHYLADPFVICRNGKTYCFVEDFDYTQQRGCIDVYELTDGGGIRLGIALEEDFHLSFPTCSSIGAISICVQNRRKTGDKDYKCIEFPLRWKWIQSP